MIALVPIAFFYSECVNFIISIPVIQEAYTAKNTVVSPYFLVWKFCGKAQLPHSFGGIARNYAETVSFRKISTPGNQVKLPYFSQ